MYGVIDLSRGDTTPGAGGVLAPPHGWTGEAAAYRAWLRERFREDIGARQQLLVMARWWGDPGRPPVALEGPYAEEAAAILDDLAVWCGGRRRKPLPPATLPDPDAAELFEAALPPPSEPVSDPDLDLALEIAMAMELTADAPAGSEVIGLEPAPAPEPPGEPPQLELAL